MEGVVHDSHDELNEGSRHTLPAIRLLIVIVFWWLFGLILHTYHLAGLGEGGAFASWTESFFFSLSLFGPITPEGTIVCCFAFVWIFEAKR